MVADEGVDAVQTVGVQNIFGEGVVAVNDHFLKTVGTGRCPGQVTLVVKVENVGRHEELVGACGDSGSVRVGGSREVTLMIEPAGEGRFGGGAAVLRGEVVEADAGGAIRRLMV